MPQTDTRPAGVASPFDGLLAGAATGVGSLPHRDARAAAEFSLRENELVMIPSLPRRSPAESLIAQAVVGTPGVTLGQYGAIAVDLDRLDPEAPVITDMAADGFGGFRAFLDHATESGIAGTTVKWSFVGPVTLGVALIRAGAPPEIAFDVSVRCVRSHVAALGRAVAEALPGSPQLVVLDEPAMADLMSPDFALPPDAAVDLLSTAMAAGESLGAVGVHCCAPADWASLLAAGPRVLSMPATRELASIGGYLQRFLEDGGWIAWGAVAVDGPIGVTGGRAWHQLSKLWCEFVRSGVDPVLIRRQSMITPHCGLGVHSVSVAERVYQMVRDIARRVRDQSTAARFVLGA